MTAAATETGLSALTGRPWLYEGTRIPHPIPTILQVPPELRESDDILEINFGPNHPSTHGVLRLVVSLDGGSPTQITDGDYIDADPTWAPDGESIVFASARHAARDDDDASDLWRVPVKGGTPQQLTATTGPVMLPAFSPDRRTIAFVDLSYSDTDPVECRGTLTTVAMNGVVKRAPDFVVATKDFCQGPTEISWTRRGIVVSSEWAGGLVVVDPRTGRATAAKRPKSHRTARIRPLARTCARDVSACTVASRG